MTDEPVTESRDCAMADGLTKCPGCGHSAAAAGPAGICIGCPCPLRHGNATEAAQ